MTIKQTQKAYRLKYNITNTADVCEIAHKKTVTAIRNINKKLTIKKLTVNCNHKKCKDCGQMEHYSEQAQNIFNDYYDNICELAGI